MAHGSAHSGGGGRGDRTSTGDGDSLNIEERDSHLPPIQQRLRAMHDAQNGRAADAPVNLHKPEVLADFGSFIPVAQQTWAAQVAVVKDRRSGLGFNPSRLVDGIIAKKSGIRGLYDPSHRDYARYVGLRTNIAVLRNYLRGRGVSEQKLKTIAEELGDAFANDRWWKRPITRWLNSDVACVESVGAAEMYKHLLGAQQKPVVLEWLRVAINSVFGIRDRKWDLPPLEATAFSPAGLAAPLSASPAADMAVPSSEFVDRYLSSQNASSHYSRA